MPESIEQIREAKRQAGLRLLDAYRSKVEEYQVGTAQIYRLLEQIFYQLTEDQFTRGYPAICRAITDKFEWIQTLAQAQIKDHERRLDWESAADLLEMGTNIPDTLPRPEQGSSSSS